MQISTCQYKGITRIDLFACDDIEAVKSLFYSPRRLNKGEVFSVSESRLKCRSSAASISDDRLQRCLRRESSQQAVLC